jgi:pSer/pThr/pTyr-binding forkhead associated (FHA) protein
MSLKSIIGKVFNKKSPEDELKVETEDIHHEVSFRDTVVEQSFKDTMPVAEAAPAENEIIIYVHDEKASTHTITATTHIGRDPSQTEIAIPELIVSKLHCTLYLKNNEVFIKDNDSTNGTFVNGKEIHNQKLEDNDLITLGRKGTVRIIFHKKQ